VSTAGIFPWLGPNDYYEFPDPRTADADGMIGIGGNLSPGMLLAAYRQGIFPWFNETDPIIWWSPDPRFVIFSAEVHVSRSMRRFIRQGRLRVTLDHAFGRVIHGCATTPRKGQRGTWITEDMELAYRRLHELGYAHSCEVWDSDRLVGGLYGVSIGRMFFAESMYSHVDNASKTALISIAGFLASHGYDLIDSQLHTSHVERMGGRLISRDSFLDMVAGRVALPGLDGMWSGLL